MKVLLIALTLLISSIAYNQNIKKLIKNNDIVAVEKYINSHVVLDELIFFPQDDYSIHPLIYASGVGNYEIVKLFIQNEEKIDDFHDIMSTAFIMSLSLITDSISNYLYNLTPNINETCLPCHGHNAIMVATVYGKEDWYFKLKPKSTLNALSYDGNNLLHLSALNKNFSQKIFDDILTLKEVDINLENNFKRTPLQSFAQLGNYIQFKKLITLNAKYYNLTDLYADAIYGGNLNIYNYVVSLLTKKPYWTTLSPLGLEDENTYYPLELAINNNNLAVSKLILNDMFNQVKTELNDSKTETLVNILNSRKMEKDTFWPLWISIEFQNKDMFEFLLKKSLELNEANIEYTYFDDLMDNEYTGKAEVLFKKYDYRSAKKVFGKTYIKNLYSELSIVF